MTLQPRLVAGGDDSDRPHVEFSRLLCDDGHSASCRGGTEKTQDSRGVEGRTATGLDAASCIRQEGRRSALGYQLTMASAERWGIRTNGYSPLLDFRASIPL